MPIRKVIWGNLLTVESLYPISFYFTLVRMERTNFCNCEAEGLKEQSNRIMFLKIPVLPDLQNRVSGSSRQCYTTYPMSYDATKKVKRKAGGVHLKQPFGS